MASRRICCIWVIANPPDTAASPRGHKLLVRLFFFSGFGAVFRLRLLVRLFFRCLGPFCSTVFFSGFGASGFWRIYVAKNHRILFEAINYWFDCFFGFGAVFRLKLLIRLVFFGVWGLFNVEITGSAGFLGGFGASGFKRIYAARGHKLLVRLFVSQGLGLVLG